MKIIAGKLILKYGFWLNIFLIAAGLTVGFISERWDIIPFTLIVIGVVLTIAWLLWQSKLANLWARRSTQTSTNAILATTAVLVILGLINFLGARYSIRQDLTENQLFTLAPQSKELVRSLKSPVKVWIFDITQNAREKELLVNYQRQNSKFKFEYVDTQAKPSLVKKFGVDNNVRAFLESGKRQVKIVEFNEPLTEIKLTNCLQKLISTDVLTIYFLKGHSEDIDIINSNMSKAVEALAEMNLIAKPLTFTNKSLVPDDAAVVIVGGDSQDLFPNEVKLLQAYLKRGGNLLLMFNPRTAQNLDPLLSEWGVSIDPRLVVDISGSAILGPAVSLVNNYGQHPITKNFGNKTSFYQFARPINTKTVEGVQSNPFLLTKPYPHSWAESDLNSEILRFNEKSDHKGPLALGIALKRKIVGKTDHSGYEASHSNTLSPVLPINSYIHATKTQVKNRESRLVVIGNSNFASNSWFQKALNGDVFLNSVTWLSQRDFQPLSIRPKEAKNRRINLSPAQASLLTIFSLVILPLIGIIGAVPVWWQRR